MKINTLPAPTWRWLRMNQGETDFDAGKGGRLLIAEQRGDWAPCARDFSAVKGSAGEAFAALAANMEEKPLALSASGEALLRLCWRAEEGAALDRVRIAAEPGSRVTAVMDIAAPEGCSGEAGLETLLLADEGAEFTLVQIFRVGAEGRSVVSVGGECAKDARIRLIQLVLDGRETDLGAHVLLRGEGSDFTARIGYRANRDHRIDMNYVVPHEGKRTTCDIQAAGVLEDTARKIFRGTIDFRRGSAGAVGAETEDVLLMNDGTVNQTIPLILCAEEDVSGTHGATIGRLSEELVYYMASRGMPVELIYRQMALSRLNAVAAQIPDEATRVAVAEYLNGADFDTDGTTV